MGLFKQFEKTNASHFELALFVAFHAAQLKQLQDVDEETLETMNVTSEEVEGYAMTVDGLMDRSRDAQATTETDETTTYDVERDRLLSVIFYLVATGLMSTVEKEQEAAKTLDVILRVYKGIQKKAMDAETQMIRGLLADLKEGKAAEAVTTLHLSDTITQLETINDKFDEAKEKRVKKRQDKFMQTKTSDLRLLADEQLEEIQDDLRAAGILARRKPESAVLLNMISDLIDDMNAITRNFKTVYRQSTAQRKLHRKTNGGDGGEEGGDGDLEFVPVEK